jgi:Protein of unknown function (DUF4238)
MAGSAPRRHHTVTAGYVRRFTAGGVVEVHRGERVLEVGPRGVGYQLDFWGSPELAGEMEGKFQHAENGALDVLAELPDRWPLTGADRGVLGEFLAIHIVRQPSYGGLIRQMGERANREVLAEHHASEGLDPRQSAWLADWLSGERVHADTLLRHIPRLGSFLCSMHWTLVEFDQDWLISGDQPLVLLLPVPQPITPASALLPAGFSYTLEGRFTLDPRRALLLSWSEEPSERWLTGTHAQACSINCALRAQALGEWFCRPGTRPPFLSPLLLTERVYPISAELLGGYTVEDARSSRRREAAERIVHEMIDEQAPPNRMRWVRVAERRVAGSGTV